MKEINNILKKDFIYKSTSLYATLVLIIKKLNNSLYICVDYRALNTIIIRNYNVSLLIRETLSRLYIIK